MIEVGDVVKYKKGTAEYVVERTRNAHQHINGDELFCNLKILDRVYENFYNDIPASKLEIVRKGPKDERFDDGSFLFEAKEDPLTKEACRSFNFGKFGASHEQCQQVSRPYIPPRNERCSLDPIGAGRDLADSVMYALNNLKENDVNDYDKDKMKKVVEKLNGLKGKEYEQAVYEKRSFKISLYSILKENAEVKEMDLGKDALLSGITIEGDRVILTVKVGDVEVEKGEA